MDSPEVEEQWMRIYEPGVETNHRLESTEDAGAGAEAVHNCPAAVRRSTAWYRELRNRTNNGLIQGTTDKMD